MSGATAIDLARAELKVTTALRTLYGGAGLRPVLPDLVGECIVGQAIRENSNLVIQVMDFRPQDLQAILHLINRVGNPESKLGSLRDSLAPVATEALTAALLNPPRYHALIPDLLLVGAREPGGISTAATRALENLPPPLDGALAAALLSDWQRLFPSGLIPHHLRDVLGSAALLAGQFSWTAENSPIPLNDEELIEVNGDIATIAAHVLTDLGRDAEAFEVAQRHVASTSGSGSVGVRPQIRFGTALVNLAGRQHHLGKLGDALKTSEEGMLLLREAFAAGHQEAFKALVIGIVDHANLLRIAGRLKESLVLAREAAEMAETETDPDHELRPNETAQIYLILSGAELANGNHDAASDAAEKTIEIRSRLVEGDPAYAPRLAHTLMVKADISKARGDKAGTLPLLLEAAKLLATNAKSLTARDGEVMIRAFKRYIDTAVELGASESDANEALRAATGGYSLQRVGEIEEPDAKIKAMREFLDFSRTTHASNPYSLAKTLSAGNKELADLLIECGAFEEAEGLAAEAEMRVRFLIDEHDERLDRLLIETILLQAECGDRLGRDPSVVDSHLVRAIQKASAVPNDQWVNVADLHYSAFDAFLRRALSEDVSYEMAVGTLGEGNVQEHPLHIALNGWTSSHNADDFSSARDYYSKLVELIAFHPQHPFAMQASETIEHARKVFGEHWTYDD
jgi:hypothetical protein